MKQFSILINILQILEVILTPNHTSHKLTAVSYHKIAEKLYQRVRNESLRTQRPELMDPDIKSRICYHITGSAYFANILEEERVSKPMVELYPIIREKKPDIFDFLYEQSASPQPGRDNVIYKNRSRSISVFINERAQKPIDEYVFICSTIERYEDGDEDVLVYYISNEYNMSDTPNPYIAGRFILAASNSDPARIETYAIAEEPAISLSAPGAEVEREYLRTRVGYEPAGHESEDPICRLSRPARLRLCTILMSSEYFESELVYTPTYNHIDSMCTKKEILFQDDEVRSQMGEIHYHEWMLGCTITEYYATYQAKYFYSRVYNSINEIFLYRRGPNSKVILENLFGKIRFSI